MKYYYNVTFLLLLLSFQCNQDLKTNSTDDLPSVSEAKPILDNQDKHSNQDDITSSRRNAITRAIAKASRATVGINVTEVRKYRYLSPFLSDPLLDHLFGLSRPSYKQEVKSLGSGFLISQDGYIASNAHVVEHATKIVVTMTDGSRHEARVVGHDEITDIALLKIEGDNFPFIKFADSDDILTGEWAIALGNPFGLFEINNKPTATVGIVSATGLDFSNINGRSYKGMIQTDASINTGNSGGPLLNANGESIGVNAFIYTGGGRGSIGIGFAIPSNRVKNITKELKEKGMIDRSFKTGISIQPIDKGLAAYFGLKSSRGYIITSIERRSPGDKAGLKAGDIILEANGVKLSTRHSILDVLRELRVGDYLSLKILRGKEELTTNIKLEKG